MPQINPLAGKKLPPRLLVNVADLIGAYFALRPDPAVAAQRVSFGTSGHRGGAFQRSFNEAHILAIAQAICLYRKKQDITGPLFLGKDTHALSEPAWASALEIFAANGVETMIDAKGGFTPTPVISHAILGYNRANNKERTAGLADGVVISPSHNPPDEGGIKYNPPHGGPADAAVTGWIEKTANDFLAAGLQGVQRMPYARARKAATVHPHDYVTAYVNDLANVVDMAAIAASGVRIGIDPLGGAAVDYWAPVVARYKLKASVVNDAVDPTFGFMTADWDGKIRMDCSSPFAMARLVGMKDKFDIAFANDTDADRHGIVCATGGLMAPNAYLAAMISYLFTNRPGWQAASAVGKTVVSSAMIDRVAQKLGRGLFEVPVGFKWFSPGLLDGSLGFAGEESAGASFLRRDGSVWTTDKDGIIAGLLAAEITARTGADPAALYATLCRDLAPSFYERMDAPATAAQKTALKNIAPARVGARELAGEPITAKRTTAPGNGAPIGGLKVIAPSGWFAARPSGTEDVYKIYAESFRSAAHLAQIQAQAQTLVNAAMAG